MSKLCDYSGYACKCRGYKKAREGSTMCVCGHSKSQHNSTDAGKAKKIDIETSSETEPYKMTKGN